MTARAGTVCALLLLAACGKPRDASILLFTGGGTSPGDVAAFETLLNANRFDFATADSWQLNRMDESDLRRYRLLIVPGGNFIHIGNGLTEAATATVRSAVAHGVNYLGVCAGAFFAGNTGRNSLNLTGVRFPFYSAEGRGIHKTAVPVAVPGSPTLEHYWEDGPELSGWGSVIGRYPDGTPAMVEGAAGAGWLVLTGVHPEAPESWRRGMTFATPAAADNAFAVKLVHAAMERTPLALR